MPDQAEKWSGVDTICHTVTIHNESSGRFVVGLSQLYELSLGRLRLSARFLISRVRHDPYFQSSKPQCPHHEPRTNKNAQYSYATSQNLRIHGMYDSHACYDTYDFKKCTNDQKFVIK